MVPYKLTGEQARHLASLLNQASER